MKLCKNDQNKILAHGLCRSCYDKLTPEEIQEIRLAKIEQKQSKKYLPQLEKIRAMSFEDSKEYKKFLKNYKKSSEYKEWRKRKEKLYHHYYRKVFTISDKQYSKEYQRVNTEKIRERKSEYFKKNKERLLAYQRAYRKKKAGELHKSKTPEGREPGQSD